MNSLNFDGNLNVEEFVDWIDQVEKIFGYFEVPETKKVKLVSMNFRGRASYWWEHYQIQRSRSGEEKKLEIGTMKQKLRAQFLLFDFMSFHHAMKYVDEPVHDQYMEDGEDAIVEGEEDLPLATKILQTSKQEVEKEEVLKGKILPTDFSIEVRVCDLIIERDSYGNMESLEVLK